MFPNVLLWGFGLLCKRRQSPNALSLPVDLALAVALPMHSHIAMNYVSIFAVIVTLYRKTVT
jgi:hypothetical protein